jgi:hypothetical protein
VAVLTAQNIARSGLSESFAAATVSGDTFVNDERTFLHIKNTNAATRDVTVTPSRLVDGRAASPLVVTVAALTGDVLIGPFPAADYNNTDNVVSITYSAVTNLTIALVRLPRAS